MTTFPVQKSAPAPWVSGWIISRVCVSGTRDWPGWAPHRAQHQPSSQDRPRSRRRRAGAQPGRGCPEYPSLTSPDPRSPHADLVIETSIKIQVGNYSLCRYTVCTWCWRKDFSLVLWYKNVVCVKCKYFPSVGSYYFQICLCCMQYMWCEM